MAWFGFNTSCFPNHNLFSMASFLCMMPTRLTGKDGIFAMLSEHGEAFLKRVFDDDDDDDDDDAVAVAVRCVGHAGHNCIGACAFNSVLNVSLLPHPDTPRPSLSPMIPCVAPTASECPQCIRALYARIKTAQRDVDEAFARAKPGRTHYTKQQMYTAAVYDYVLPWIGSSRAPDVMQPCNLIGALLFLLVHFSHRASDGADDGDEDTAILLATINAVCGVQCAVRAEDDGRDAFHVPACVKDEAFGGPSTFYAALWQLCIQDVQTSSDSSSTPDKGDAGVTAPLYRFSFAIPVTAVSRAMRAAVARLTVSAAIGALQVASGLQAGGDVQCDPSAWHLPVPDLEFSTFRPGDTVHEFWKRSVPLPFSRNCVFEDVAPPSRDGGDTTHIHTVAELQAATTAAAAAAGSSSALEYFQKRRVAVCEALKRGDGAVLTSEQLDARSAHMTSVASVSVSTEGMGSRVPKRARHM